MRLALFASGSGSNVQAIIDAVQAGKLNVELVALFCDQAGARVIERAEQAGIDTLVLAPKDCPSRQAWEEAIVAFLKERKVELIVLAGFMRILGEPLLEAYPEAIVNIHPSLLPAFPGRQGIQDAYEAGVAETGVTIHWVDAGIDTGEIIVQEKVRIEADWSLDDLAQAIHQVEHRLYPATLQEIIEERRED